jgi:predicted metalloprotease with PDZ domain
LFLLVASLLVCAAVVASDEVRHTLSFPKDREQLILMRSEFPVSGPVTELMMPNWTPGSYLIRDYAANVDSISAVAEDGSALAVQKIAKDRWQVNTPDTTTLIVLYEVFTPNLSVRDSWASRAFSLVNGASVFLYTAQSRELPQLLKVTADTDRGEVFTAMLPDPAGRGYRVDNYDELVDSPVAVAKAPVYRFSHQEQDYLLLNVGENEFWDGKQAASDVKKIVAGTQSFWGENPLQKPYWFMNFIVEGGGGLEHDYSTVIMSGRRQMRDRKDYIKWLSVMAHEFFHVWNVRRMRPVELSQIDYQREQYTGQLWLAEGLTSYFDNLLLSRAGLINPDEYLELLASDIYKLETTPGRLLRPVVEASFDTWIRQYQTNSNSVNSTISYYTKGALIGFVLDTFLRKNSKDRHNLDEVMRQMYALYSSKPYGNDAFEKAVVEVGGPRAGQFLQSLLTTTQELDIDSALDWYGLKLIRNTKAKQAGKKEARESTSLQSGLGVIWDEAKPGMTIKSVLVGSSGSVAGLMPQDEVLAIGEERLTPETRDSLMTSFRPGQETTVLISRRGRIIQLDIQLDNSIPDSFNIVLQSDYKKSDIKRLQKLLGQEIK